MLSTRLNPPHTSQNIDCRQLRDRPAPDPREKIQLQAPNDLLQVAVRPADREFIEPLPSPRLEHIAARESLRPPPRRRIDARSTCAAHFIALLPRLFQRDVRVSPQRQRLLPTIKTKPKSPPLAAGRRDDQIETASVSELVGFVFCLSGFNRCVGEHGAENVRPPKTY